MEKVLSDTNKFVKVTLYKSEQRNFSPFEYWIMYQKIFRRSV